MRAWLLRIHDAASRRNFQGTFVVSGGGGVANARISHFHEGANQYERIESLDGRQRKVFRHNDVVHTLWPASKVAMIEQRGQLSSFPALLQASDDHLADWYEMKLEGIDRVAGHEADVLAVKPRDSYRYGYRLWADRASGLLLRVDVIGERGETLETAAFSEVSIGVRCAARKRRPGDEEARRLPDRPAGPDADPPRGRRLGHARRRRRGSGSSAASAGRWKCPARPPATRTPRRCCRPSTPTA